MKCRICKKEFIPSHFAQKLCCLECRKIANKEYLKKYKKSEKGKAIDKKYKTSDKYKEKEKRNRKKPEIWEGYKKRARDYYHRHKNNPDFIKKRKETNRKWYYGNYKEVREKSKIYSAKYQKSPKGKLVWANYRYLLKNNNSGKINFEQWQKKFEKMGRKCQWCGIKENLTIDHIIPLSKGGTNKIENLQSLCRRCNAKKGNK